MWADDCASLLRPAASELSDLDIYVAGFPCQPFSSAGLGKGTADKKGRGLIWTHLVQFILVAKPKCVILENVVGFTQGKHKATFARMLSLLDESGTFTWQWKVLNTRDYGVAQNRERVYVIGLRNDAIRRQLVWPEKTAASSSPSLDAFLEPQVGIVDLATFPTGLAARRKCVAALSKLVAERKDPRRTPAACSVNNRRAATMVNCSPCLTARRASEGGHWLLHRARFMTDAELFQLQGLKAERWQLPAGLEGRKHELRSCVGNAMSGNVIKLLLQAVLQSMGVFDEQQ